MTTIYERVFCSYALTREIFSLHICSKRVRSDVLVCWFTVLIVDERFLYSKIEGCVTTVNDEILKISYFERSLKSKLVIFDWIIDCI